MPNPELRPCPFCGQTPAMRQVYSDAFAKGELQNYYVACLNEKCALQPVTLMNFLTRRQAAAAWNRRAGEDAR